MEDLPIGFFSTDIYLVMRGNIWKGYRVNETTIKDTDHGQFIERPLSAAQGWFYGKDILRLINMLDVAEK